MVWKIVDGDAVAPVGQMFSTKGVKIPPTWNSWTDDNKKEHGLYWENDPVVAVSYTHLTLPTKRIV